MEFHEKLQELRKNRGMTQEELAEALYVSRTAISKWESGRGYPNIDSLKDISVYFSVSIDDLLSGDKLIVLAKKENRSHIQDICDLLLGIVDFLALLLILLPLYPKTIEDSIYSVNLWDYTDIATYNLKIYWFLFLSMTVVGVCKLLQTCLKMKQGKKIVTGISFILGIITVLYLVMTREPYAATVAIVLTMVKSVVLFKCLK